MKCYLIGLNGTPKLEIAPDDVIGRSGNHPFPESQKMSKRHCQISFEKGTYFIQDLGSTNGTFLNGDRLDKQTKYELRQGQIIRISDLMFQVNLIQEEIVYKPSPGASIPKPTVRKSHQHKLTFELPWSKLVGLTLKNGFLTIFSLGLYYPWALADARRMIWGATKIGEGVLYYTGTGKDLFKGFMLFLGGALAWSFCEPFLQEGIQLLHPDASIFWDGVNTALLLLIFLNLRFRSYSNKLNHTQFQSIKFGVSPGAKKEFLRESVWGALLTLASLGLYLPILLYRLERLKWSSTLIGGQRVNYEATQGAFLKMFLFGVGATLLTAGLYLPWFIANYKNFHHRHLKFGNLMISSNLQGDDYLIFGLKVQLLGLLTLGMGFAYIMVLHRKLLFSSLVLKGSINFSELSSSGNANGAGETRSEFIDTDAA